MAHVFAKNVVVLIAHRRSGTTVLKDMLRNSGDYYFEGNHEVFRPVVANPKNFYHFWHQSVLEEPENLYAANRHRLMLEFMDREAEVYPADRAGFDIKYYQFSQCGSLFDMIGSSNCFIIHLVRSNAVKGYVSDLLLAQTRKEGQTARKLKVENVQDFEKGVLNRIRETELYTRRISGLKLPETRFASFEYENLFSDVDHLGSGQCLNPEYVRKLATSLGSSDQADDFVTTRKKENAPTCRDSIENFDDVFEKIVDSRIKEQMAN